MAHFADLSPCSYFPFDHEHKLLAVGWLEQGHEYHQGSVADDFLSKFQHLIDHWWEPCRFVGWHDCSFCPPCRTWERQKPETHSFRNVLVPGQNCLFVAPEILPHYVTSHGYSPPIDFQRAVLACPDPEKSREQYLRLVLETAPLSLKQDVEAKFRNEGETMTRNDIDKEIEALKPRLSAAAAAYRAEIKRLAELEAKKERLFLLDLVDPFRNGGGRS